MRRLILTFFTVFAAWQSFAQFGNEWIRHNQQYYKISVAKDGIYRLTYNDLQNAGFLVGSPDPRRVQLFHRGVEQDIYIEGEADAIFHPTDYIEFYGRKNDGVSDAELYKPISTQPHQYYNLYSDTTSYFLTVNLTQLGNRMQVFSEVNVSGIPKEVFHINEKLLVLSSQYSSGIKHSTYIQNTFFETGEGWTGNQISQNQFIDYEINNIVDTSPASGSPTIEIQIVGRAEVQHQVEVSVGSSVPSRVVGTRNFSGSNTITFNAVLNWSDIGSDGKIFVRIKALGVSGAADRLSASYIKIRYPQTFNQSGTSGKSFQLNEKVSNKSYVEIQNVPVGTRLYDITDPIRVVRIGTTSTATLNAVVPNTATSRKVFVTSIFITPIIRKASFRNIDPIMHDYVIISHKALMKPALGYADVVRAYAAYRASSSGGSYDTLVMDVNQLYDQFNYGEISPLAISRFMAFLVNTNQPRYLFIIGKGLDVWWDYHRNPSAHAYNDFVPSAGMPASDMFYTAGLAATGFEPAVPTGRITSNTPQDVGAYLDKVKEMEALPFNNLWRKELLHLSGGINPGEPELFKSYMEQFGSVAKSFYLGGQVASIAKNKTEIEFINISDKVNSGVNLITLFGHSSPSQNDFNIGFVTAPELGYNNPGKYPIFLINGCNAGDFFHPSIRYGEDWVNAPNKGALGFMANTSFGFASLLKGYSQTFYSVAYGDSTFIHRSIGEVQKEVVKRFTSISTAIPYVTQAQQMFLLGDPAVKLFGASKPDYEINGNNLYTESFTNDPVTALSDSFAIKIIVRNFGRAQEDSIAVRITRTFSDNTWVEYDSIFPPVLYRDTLTFTVYKENKGFGNNVFSITIDPLNEINEIDKVNNVAEINVFVPLNAARNLFPQDFSIVNSSTVNLVVQSTDVLGLARDFVLQIDTINTFNSPYAQEFVVNGKIAKKEFNVLTATDTLAFYWRTRLAQPQPDESADWTSSSFTYILNGSEGWAQVHFPQYYSNETTGLVKDTVGRKLQLKETITDVSIHTFGSGNPTPFRSVSVKLNQSEFNPQSLPELQCRNNTINLIAFNKTTTFPYVAIPAQYPDKRACGRRPEAITSFILSELEAADGKNIIQYINNVPLGDSVVLFSIGNPGYASWSGTVRSKLAELGISSTQITTLQSGEPVIIFSKKGAAPGSANVIKSAIVPANQQELQVEKTVTGRYVSGDMTSTVIGPAVEWKNFGTNVHASEFPVTDQFSFDVIGMSLTGVETVLKSGLSATLTDISDINAEQYPYMKLVFYASDEVNVTSPQLSHWIVEYTPAPEGVLTFYGPVITQSLKEGEIWTGVYGFSNVSDKEFSDSLLVQYTAYNSTLRTSYISSKRIFAPMPGEETSFTFVVNTDDKAGLNDVKVFVNPRILSEVYYDNNILELRDYLNVQADVFNPVLDVTIDGRYLSNGDFVSSSPSMIIKLWDENSLLLKTDTIGVSILLKFPCEVEDCPYTPIYFTRQDVEWYPATSDSDFTTVFNPQNLPTGSYTLLVEARDVRNNASGSTPYEITFIVGDDNEITIRPPYPNPSTSIFFFDIIVQGDNRPDLMTLEIINMNGKIVDGLTHSSLFTGTNVISWDCSDLPRGLYFYRQGLFQNGKQINSKVGKVMVVR